jgi:outer membrane lipoprotein-sorting protein
MKFLIHALAANLLLAWSANSFAQTTQPDDPELQNQLTQIDQKAALVKSVSASFKQEKFTEMLKEPLVSKGTVRAAAAQVRWDTATPEPSVLYVDADELRMYYPSEKSEEIYPIDRKISSILASPLPRLSVIRENFKIERAQGDDLKSMSTRPSELALRLTPTQDSLKQHVHQVIVILDTNSGLADAVQTEDSDGDRTVISFSDVKLNADLKPGDLNLVVPAGTSVSHPLEGTSHSP